MKELVANGLAFVSSLHPWALFAVLILLIAGSLLLIPWVVVQIPADYFSDSVRRPPLWSNYPRWLRLLLILVKNLLGLLLVMSGLTLIFLPGPGLMTIVLGLLMLDVPGKFRFERWLLSHQFILQPVNWLRIKRNKPALQLD